MEPLSPELLAFYSAPILFGTVSAPETSTAGLVRVSADVVPFPVVEDGLTESLGWTGLGYCDGGSIGSGTMEACCFVVDFDIAKVVLSRELAGTRFSDYTTIYDEDA